MSMETNDIYESGEQQEQHREDQRGANFLERKLENKLKIELDYAHKPSYLQPPYKKINNFLDYASPFTYQERFEQERRDILKFIPTAVMNKFPVQGNEWLYGWTIRGTNQVNVRDDLYGLKKLETDIHECTHTPDEYETRRRTEWKMETLLGEERGGGKYGRKRREYKI